MSEFRLPSGGWRCAVDGVTEPCGECGGCREIAAINRSGVRDDIHNTPLTGWDFDRIDYTDEFWEQVPEGQRLGPAPTAKELAARLAGAPVVEDTWPLLTRRQYLVLSTMEQTGCDVFLAMEAVASTAIENPSWDMDARRTFQDWTDADAIPGRPLAERPQPPPPDRP